MLKELIRTKVCIQEMDTDPGIVLCGKWRVTGDNDVPFWRTSAAISWYIQRVGSPEVKLVLVTNFLFDSPPSYQGYSWRSDFQAPFAELPDLIVPGKSDRLRTACSWLKNSAQSANILIFRGSRNERSTCQSVLQSLQPTVRLKSYLYRLRSSVTKSYV